MHTLIVLIGPTGVGKTELSLRLAEHFHTCIVSADSRQLYADLKIGTAAPTPEQLQRVQHHFVGTLKLTDYYSAAQYEAEVMKLLEDLFTKHNTVLLTGGSMMYVDAVCKGIDDIPTVDADTRQLMLHKYETEGLERLCAELKLLDPEYYKIVDLKNPKRVVHALEICYMTGKAYTSFRTQQKKERPFRIIKIGLTRNREELYERINRRVDILIERGLVDEVSSLMQMGLGYDDISMIDIALFGQYSENNFNGVNCGIMDQFAIAMGKKDQAIFLDTSDLSYTYAPIKLADEKIVIACSNKKRGLGDSKYNERRAECEEALAELQTKLDIKALGELSEEEFEANKDLIKSEVRQRRAKHAVYENQRTLKAVDALKAGNLEEFGKLMNASHVSLRDDYEVTGIELDTLVENAWEQEGVIGSRMTGAGFGGCTVSIVKTDCVDKFIENVGKAYLEKIGYAADFYVVEIGDGGRVLA